MDEKKAFFARPSPAKIKEGREPVVVLDNKQILKSLLELKEEQYLIIPTDLFDDRFLPGQKFFRHAEAIQLRNKFPFRNTPSSLLEKAINDPQCKTTPYTCGYSFRPLSGSDRTLRRVPFVELLEAARILAYGKSFPGADVAIDGEYTGALRAVVEGGSFTVSTPSRRKKQSRYLFNIHGIPIDSSENFVYKIPYGFRSEMTGVKSKAFREIRFNFRNSKEPSQFYYVHAHEIAAAYAVAETELKSGNETPAKFSLFTPMSQLSADLYLKLVNRTLLRVMEEEKIEERRLSQSHIEATLGGFVRRYGYKAAFDDTALLEGRLRNYNWNHVQA